MQENANLSVLIVDPSQGMRGSLQNMLNQTGISKVESAVNASTAIKQLGKRSYDIILCEYDLGGPSGDGQDGQQLLEDLRHHRLITASTIFIMLTSEGVYDKVVSAAELTPTDYVLKPFTVEMLSSRIKRALERRTALLPVWQLAAQGKPVDAIRACATAAIASPRYALDFLRLKAELHVSVGEQREAAAIYRDVLAERPLGWAGLGLARTMVAQGQFEEARDTLEALVQANPRLMAAYDLLARCHEQLGASTDAQKVLEEAVSISPHMVRRLRKLGEVAMENGDAEAAEKSFKQVVTKARYSEFRNPEDHVNLVKALVTRGDVAGAVGVIRDLERSMRGNANVDACKAYSNALLLEKTGNVSAAVAELSNAVSAARTSSGLSSNLRINLAQACLEHQMDEQASNVMMTVMHDTSSAVTVDEAMGVFVRAGRPDLADGMGQQLRAQAQILLGVADEKRNMGDVRGAVQTLLEALHMAPGNLQVMVAVAGGILRQVNELGWDHSLAEVADEQIERLRAMDPAHPRLAALLDEFQQAKRKYGIST
ncbi:tetratricopeptide repeat-containing response regulator [Massilia sp. IC2-476]|uniref:tetratricopeptide repeat-containing response regulator n=1 Tax=Massilia sp. IC2-476 TaxID=2887199 RepID=UPI001D11D768|nr:tetratricopeptide repeat-containing response regulator [Massilia sp. IC2-476]MCC2974425.1 tetratricopeptide repeat protein [Massilia sp. IC2-476]